jgi:hypothetical protein
MACVILFKTELEKGCNYKLTLVPFENLLLLRATAMATTLVSNCPTVLKWRSACVHSNTNIFKVTVFTFDFEHYSPMVTAMDVT